MFNSFHNSYRDPFKCDRVFNPKVEDKPEPIYMDDDEEEVIQIQALSEKKYLPGMRLLEKLKKQEKKKINEKRLAKRLANIVKLF